MAEGIGPGYDKGHGNWTTVNRNRRRRNPDTNYQQTEIDITQTRTDNGLTRYEKEIGKTQKPENRFNTKPPQKPTNTIMIKLKAANYNRNKHYGNEIYRILQVSYDQIFNTNTIIKIVFEEKHRTYLNSDEVRDKLKKEGYEIVQTPQEKANRSIYCRNLDPTIAQLNPTEIKETIEKQNEWIKIEETIKMKNTAPIIKIVCKNENMAQKSTQNGLYAGYTRIPPHKIAIEEYTDLLLCFHCYEYESHPTYQCPHKDEKKPCSECSSKNHDFTQCTQTFKKCLNCNGPHKTTAMRCPYRKLKMEEKKNKIVEEKDLIENRSYANVIQSVIKNQEKPTPQIVNVNNDHGFKSTFCIIYAHIQNLAQPGTFTQHLHQILKANNLPQMNIPTGNKHSEKIFNMHLENTNNDTNINIPTNNTNTQQYTHGETETEMEESEIETEEQQEEKEYITAEEEEEDRRTKRKLTPEERKSKKKPKRTTQTREAEPTTPHKRPTTPHAPEERSHEIKETEQTNKGIIRPLPQIVEKPPSSITMIKTPSGERVAYTMKPAVPKKPTHKKQYNEP